MRIFGYAGAVQFLEHHFIGKQYYSQRVLDIVCHAGGQFADGRQAPGVDQAPLEILDFPDIPENRESPAELAIIVVDAERPNFNRDPGPIFGREDAFDTFVASLLEILESFLHFGEDFFRIDSVYIHAEQFFV